MAFPPPENAIHEIQNTQIKARILTFTCSPLSPLHFLLPPPNSIPEQIGREIEKAVKGIFPLSVVYIRKVKVLKKPKFDLVKLMEIHEGQTPVDDTGAGIDRPEEPAIVPEIAGSGGRL